MYTQLYDPLPKDGPNVGDGGSYPYMFSPGTADFQEMSDDWDAGIDWCMQRFGRYSLTTWTIHGFELIIMFRDVNAALEFKLQFC